MKNSFTNMTPPELHAKREELVKKHFDLRFQMVMGHVENPMLKRTMRRQIARLNSLIRKNEIADQASKNVAAAAAKPVAGKE
jgi:large subunit ribosomal protein L29